MTFYFSWPSYFSENQTNSLKDTFPSPSWSITLTRSWGIQSGRISRFHPHHLQFALWGFPATCSHHLTYLTVPHSPEPKSLEKLSLPFVPLCDINSEMCVSPSLLWCGGVGSGVPCLSLPSWFYPVQPCRTAWRAACTPPAGRGTATERPGGEAVVSRVRLQQSQGPYLLL